MASHLKTLPLVNSWLNRIDREIAQYGLQKALNELGRRHQVKVKLNGWSEELERALKEDPVLIAGNHPADYDPFVLFGELPSRKDIFLVANYLLKGISSELEKHLLPVYVGHNIVNEENRNYKYKIFKKIHNIEWLTVEESRKRNREAIATASKKLNEGAAVCILPGAGGINDEWMPGIGYMLNGVKDPASVKVILFRIENTSNKDYLRLIPGVSKIMPTIEITFHRPISGEKFVHKNAKVTMKSMELFYRRWTKSLAIQATWHLRN